MTTDGLQRALHGLDCRFDAYSRSLYSRDASMYRIVPKGVVFPRDASEVSRAVSVAAEHGVPVVPRGAATSLAGQTVGPGLIMDLSRHMHRILRLDAQERTASVQPGVIQDQLNRAAAQHGLMFGPDTSTSNRATVGGMIGNNSAGSGSLRYGMTIDHVRELAVVLADGSATRFAPVDDDAYARWTESANLASRIHRELPRLVRANEAVIAAGMPSFWRCAGGYRLERILTDGIFDPVKVIVGSEGTLAVVTEAVVNLVPKPQHTVIAVGHFRTTAEAVAATTDAMTCDPSAVELMDRTILELSRAKPEYAGLSELLVDDPGALLFVSFAGDHEDVLLAQLDQLCARWRENGHGYYILRAVTAAQQNPLLKVRKASLGLLMAAGTGTRRPLAFVEDTAVDPIHLAEYTDRFQKILDHHGLTAGFYGHCSVGCLHIRPFVDLTDPRQVETMRQVAVEIKDLVAEYGGVNSSEHGDGLARSIFNREIFGDELYETMCQVKRLFDPGDVLNPGKIVESPPMTAGLRDAALPSIPMVSTKLSFDAEGGLFAAADRCMNIGLCRKTDSGVMCPSYQATRDEEHSTRGRSNALVTALTEPDPRGALGDRRLHEVLDLCLMCKACKSECPLGVDMAALKTEVLDRYHEQHGTPLRARVFSEIRLMNRLGSRVAPLANRLSRARWLRWSAERTIGVTAQRPVPTYARTDLLRWVERRPRPQNLSPRGEVILLADSFTTYNEPDVGQSAVELLERAGWRVEVVGDHCCGRPGLSEGLIDQTRKRAAGLVAALAATSPSALIVGIEPSCTAMLRDEYRRLLPDDQRRADVAHRVVQLEQLLGEAIDAGHLRLRADSWLSGARLVYQGHCHQKADVGTAATMALLRRIPGVEVTELDAGCCGMAGAFGYESEHYPVSMQVGRERLFPALESEPAETVVVASGFSCRQQIRHGAARQTHHPLQVIASVAED